MAGVVLAILFMRMPSQTPHADATPLPPALKDGLRYAIGVERVRRLLLITAGLGFFALPYQQLLPVVARDRLGTGPEGLGLLIAIEVADEPADGRDRTVGRALQPG
jgi:hypothetical protein